MDPVEQLRLLRDDSRWVEEELDFDAYAQPVRRRWGWPRIAGFSVAGIAVAAAAALVIAGVHGSWNAAPVPAGPSTSASVSPAVVLPACDSTDLRFGLTEYTPTTKWGQLQLAGWFTGTNTSNRACSMSRDAEPLIQVVDTKQNPVSDRTLAFVDQKGTLGVQPGDTFYVPFAAYMSPGPHAACLEESAGLILNVPGWSFGHGFVAKELPYCVVGPNVANWSAAGQPDAAALEQDIHELSVTETDEPTAPPTSITEPQCTTDELSAALAPDRSSDQGTDWAIIEVTNTGKRSCEIGPDASITWIAGTGGSPLGVAASTGASGNDPALISPGQSAGVIIGFVQAGTKEEGSCDPMERDWLRLSLGGAGSGGSASLDVDIASLRMHMCVFSDGRQQLKVFGPQAGASLHD